MKRRTLFIRAALTIAAAGMTLGALILTVSAAAGVYPPLCGLTIRQVAGKSLVMIRRAFIISSASTLCAGLICLSGWERDYAPTARLTACRLPVFLFLLADAAVTLAAYRYLGTDLGYRAAYFAGGAGMIFPVLTLTSVSALLLPRRRVRAMRIAGRVTAATGEAVFAAFAVLAWIKPLPAFAITLYLLIPSAALICIGALISGEGKAAAISFSITLCAGMLILPYSVAISMQVMSSLVALITACAAIYTFTIKRRKEKCQTE